MRALFLVTLLAVFSGCSDAAPLNVPDAGGCQQSSECDDGAYCNGQETCGAGTCVDGQAPCSGACDEALDLCTAVTDCDSDGDGMTSVACGGADCDDHDSARFPGAVELCDDSHDEDCDAATVGIDRDGDGFVSDACCNGDSCGLDCDDTLRGVFPGAVESCNGRDDDCDGEVDEGVLRAFYPDMDGDGFGNRDATPTMACSPPAVNYVEDSRDCNDHEVLSNPGTSEGCDDIDNDCDGEVDEAGSVRWYRDSDGDSFGDPNDYVDVVGCDSQVGRVLSSTDCDDSRAGTHPGASEVCDRLDSDCSYVPDRGGVDPGEDRDQDGHAPVGAVCVGGLPADDCNDNDNDAFPGNRERCSGTDQDCDNQIDEGGAAFCGVGNSCDGTCISNRSLDGWNGSHTFVLTSPYEGFAVDNHAFRFCALRAGVPYCWGNPCVNGGTFQAHCDGTLLPNGQHPLHATPVTGLPGLAEEIATGLSHACARVGGRVLCWGSNAKGELGNGTTTPSITPVVARLPSDDAVALSAGDAFTCAIRRDQTVWCWGTGANAAIGSTASLSSTPVRVPNVTGAIAITSGRRHTCVRHGDETVSCWGDNVAGQTGAAANEFQLPTRVVGLDNVRAIAASIEGTCALRSSGAIQCFGATPGDEPMSTEIDSIAVSQYCIAGHRYDDGVEAFGETKAGCRAAASFWRELEDLTPSETITGLPATEVAGSRKVLCARNEDESVRCWGQVSGRYAGFIAGAMDGFVEVATGSNHTCARTAGGRVSCAGMIDTMAYPEAIDMGLSGVSSLDTAGNMSCAVLNDGTARCWGYGAVRVGTYLTFSAQPESPGELGHVVEVAINGTGSTACARRIDDTIFCWGDYYDTTGTVALPLGAIPTGIAVAATSGCATLDDGQLACWGTEPWSPTGANRNQATLVTGVTDAVAVAAGDRHICILHSGGTVSCWGKNNEAQLGDDSRVDASTPRLVQGLTGVVQVAAGGSSSCARTNTGSVWCWGTHTRWQDPPFGEVLLQSSIPEHVLGIDGATDLDGGRHGPCAIAAGRVHCMGFNNEGRFGLGAILDVVFP